MDSHLALDTIFTQPLPFLHITLDSLLRVAGTIRVVAKVNRHLIRKCSGACPSYVSGLSLQLWLLLELFVDVLVSILVGQRLLRFEKA